MDRERLQREMEETGVGQEGRHVEEIQRTIDQRGEAAGGQQGAASQHQQGGMETGGELNTGAGVDTGGAAAGLGQGMPTDVSQDPGGEDTGLAGGRASGGAGRD